VLTNVIQQGQVDLEHDEEVGFELISTDDIDDIGVREIIRRIRERVGNSPVYLSFDIDVIGTHHAATHHSNSYQVKHRSWTRPRQ
jgi:arginase family enzyme